MLSPNSMPGLLLVGGTALAGAAFGALNWHWLAQRHLLEAIGVPTTATVEVVTISHKACASSVQLRWNDANGSPHRGHFMTCFANRSQGDQVKVRYLGENPDFAMIETGDGGIPDDQFRRGVWIGALVSVVMGLTTMRMAIARR